MVEFALNNAVHASTGFTPFYLNGLRHPQVPLTLRGGTVASIVSGGEARKAFFFQSWISIPLDTKNLPLKVVSYVKSNKLKHGFIDPLEVLARHDTADIIDLPKSMAMH
ncbi:Pol protein [Phytophthora palmivora]|uniref:Pol protein n=1 Tax=Phytophthora palmivora TaxID=4796 RepID=A0A2P4X2N9_9STRA|nr:Pol protein [Phytophthora palmivora]